MVRTFLCAAVLVGLASFSFAADNKDTKNAGNDNGQTATVKKVDSKNHTVTLSMKDKNGKEEDQTFDLTNDVKITDQNGKSAHADSLKDGEEVRVVEHNGKLAELRVEGANGSGTAHHGDKNNGEEATITKVDPKAGTVTVRMKDKNGKEQERTFTLTEDARYLDSSGRVAALDVFRSGNEVLVVEEQGKLKQMQQNDKEKNGKESKPGDKNSDQNNSKEKKPDQNNK